MLLLGGCLPGGTDSSGNDDRAEHEEETVTEATALECNFLLYSDQCMSCLSNQCGQELQNTFGSSERATSPGGSCGGWMSCLADCDCNDMTCVDACSNADVGQQCNDDADRWATCMDTQCAVQCACGNGLLDAGEQCDGEQSLSCTELGYASGMATCTDQCTFDTSACEAAQVPLTCGDWVVDPGEDCDQGELNGASCSSLGYTGGDLHCTESCRFATVDCFDCGDGVVDPQERCEPTDLRGSSCSTYGYGSGQLQCGFDCTEFDTSACSTCGNDWVDEGEQCDGTVFEPTCAQAGYAYGTMGCSTSCVLDASSCVPRVTGDCEEPLRFEGDDVRVTNDIDHSSFAGGVGCDVDSELWNGWVFEWTPVTGGDYLISAVGSYSFDEIGLSVIADHCEGDVLQCVVEIGTRQFTLEDAEAGRPYIIHAGTGGRSDTVTVVVAHRE